MDLNDMELPALLVTGFYKNHLVEEKAPNAAVAAVAAVTPQTNGIKKSIQHLGKNQKGIGILVAYSKDVYLPDDQLHFLTSILQACRLNLGDVAIVNHFREKISFEELRQQLGLKQLLVFGVDLPVLGLPDMPLFTATAINGCSVVPAPAAEQLNNNNPESKLLKSKLWLCLKELFNV